VKPLPVLVQAVTLEPWSTIANELPGARVYPVLVPRAACVPLAHFDSVTV